jgi:hypothetical protein
MNGDIGIGKLIDQERGRDAIHIAVAPITAGEELSPGQHVCIDARSNEKGRLEKKAFASAHPSSLIGIVDPFLKQNVQRGEKFYLFLYPGTITSLRHEWVHPAFGDRKEYDHQMRNKGWIEDFAQGLGLTYDAVMEAAATYIATGDYYTFQGVDTPGIAYTHSKEFWNHYEIVTGKKVPEDKKESFFTCTC